MDNRSLSHTRWKCQYHIVFIPKYRKKVLYGKVREDVREILSILCKYKNVEIIAGAVCIDHVHLSVAIPPKLSIANFMGYLKGKSTLMIYDRHPEMQSKWDKAFWARVLMLSWDVMIPLCHADMKLPGYLSWNVPFDGAVIRPITEGISSYIHALPAL